MELGIGLSIWISCLVLNGRDILPRFEFRIERFRVFTFIIVVVTYLSLPTQAFQLDQCDYDEVHQTKEKIYLIILNLDNLKG